MKNKNKGFIALLLIVIVAMLAVGGGAYVYTQNKPIKSGSDINGNQDIETVASTQNVVVFGSDDSIKNGQVLTPQQKVVKQIITKATSTATTVAAITNCGKDMSCLIAVAPTCGPAKVSWTFTIDFMGKPLTSTANIDITKMSNKCSLTLISTDIKVDNQPAPPEVQQGFMHMKKICTYTPNDLKNVLTNWNLGNISSSDDELGNCRSVNI
jgi:hypothetical protein